MERDQLDVHVREQLRMGWLYPCSEIAKLVCPDLVDVARIEEWSPQEFIRRAIPRLAPWIQTTHGVRDRELASTAAQNLVVRMMERRPDLFFDPNKGTRAQHMFGIVRQVIRETRRQEYQLRHCDCADDRTDDRQPDPFGVLAHQEELSLLRALVLERPVSQQRALAERYDLDICCPGPVGDASKGARYLRRFHAIKAMQQRAAEMGLRPSAYGLRHRMPRSLKRPARYRRGFRPDWRSPRLRKRRRNGKLESERGIISAMTIRQSEVNERNARALRDLFSGLTESVKDRTDVMAAIRDTFEAEFARQLNIRTDSDSSSNPGPAE